MRIPFLLRITMLAVMVSVSPLLLNDVRAETNPQDKDVVLKGVISGQSGHESGGTVSIVRLDNGRYQVQLADDFFLDSAPGPYIGFGNPAYDPKSEISPLLKIRGKQIYRLDADYDPADYSHFYVWCRPFNAPLGIAQLQK